MRRSFAAAGLLGLAACADAPVGVVPTAPSTSVAARGAMPGDAPGTGRYIVLLRASAGDAATAAKGRVRGGRGVIRRSFDGALKGFAADLTVDAAAALRDDPQVLHVEADQPIRASGTQANAPWGLDRADQRTLPLSGSYDYAADGSGVTVYIVDTGINYAHGEFGGRAMPGFDALGGDGSDCNGHGSHVAGIVGGATYGMAKGARLVSARVLGCDGGGRMSDAIAALSWVTQQKQASPGTPMVVNMSLGGPGSWSMDQAIATATAAGVTVVVAAGNDGGDACGYSPGRAAAALTVGASDASDAWASFSNGGTCVDLVAPGVSIPSAWVGGTSATAWASGTSMATPHVAGAAAAWLSGHAGASAADVAQAIVGGGTSDVLRGLPAGTPNRLLHAAAPGSPAPTPPPPSGGPAVLLGSGGSAKCLEVAGGTEHAAPGLPLGIWQCHGGANQRWSLPAVGGTGEVRAYGLCLDAWGATGADGDALVIWPCHGGANQQWTRTAAGELRGHTGKCVDLWLAEPLDGRAVKLYTCHGGENQRWTAR